MLHSLDTSMTHDELCSAGTQLAIAYLRGAGYAVTRHPTGYWLIGGPATSKGHCPEGSLCVQDTSPHVVGTLRIARTIHGERPCSSS